MGSFCLGPSGDGKPPWSTDPTEQFAFGPNCDEFGDYTHRAIQTLNILDDSSQQMTPFPTTRAHKHVFNNDTPCNRDIVEAHTKGTTSNTMMGKSLLWAPC